MSTPPDIMDSATGLPFSVETLSDALQAGAASIHRRHYREPLITAACEVLALAIQQTLEPYDIPVTLQAVDQDPGRPGVGLAHVIPIAELAVGARVIDSNHGQFLAAVVKNDLDSIEALQTGQFRQSGARCVVFAPEAYETAIDDTMTRIFGSEAEDALVERAHTVYGHWWNPAHFRPYETDDDTHYWAARMMPYLKDLIAVN